MDARTLRQGRFTYRISADGEALGVAIIEVRATQDGRYSIVLDGGDIGQHWRAEFSRDFTPQSATLEMSDASAPYSMQIQYAAHGASGTQSRAGKRESFMAKFEGQVIDQRVDWAAMMAATIPAGGEIEFQVFDPDTHLSRLTGSRVATAPVTSVLGSVPAIRLDYTIYKGEHIETYSVYATRQRPHLMLREDMPNGLSIELIALDR